MPVEDFNAWLAYHSLYPLDGTREDYRSAMQCHVTASAYGARTKLDDFLIRFGESHEQPIEEVLGYFQTLASRKRT